ncbi:hypothetical protein GCM10027517_33390 [Phycicoccus ginsengisoli]
MTTTPPPAGQPLAPYAVEALLLDTTPWLSCDECFERMDTYVESLLRTGTGTDPAMDRHLLGCVACNDEAQSLIDLLRSDSR